MSEEKILENHWLCENKASENNEEEPTRKVSFLKSMIYSVLFFIGMKLIGLLGILVVAGIWYGIDQYLKSKKEIKNEAS